MSEGIHPTTGPGVGTRQDHAGDADPEAIIDAIQTPRQTEIDGALDRQWIPRMDLPGFGEPDDDCGDDIPKFCACCADTWAVGRTCGRSRCPRCAQAWIRNRATAVAAKLKAVWSYRYASESDHPFFHHLVIDIPDDWNLDGETETVYWRTLDVIKKIMDELGIAGVPIYHPYRGDAETPDDRGAWADRLFAGNDWDDVSDDLEFDPHFHIVGVAPFVDCTGVEQVQDETGFIIHRITKGEGSNVSIGNDYDMAGVVAYCLSHAGIREDSNGDMRAAAHTRVAERPWREDGWLRGNAPTIQEDTREEMDEIVRSVAPRVLGIDYQTVACVREVPEGDASTGALSLAAGSGDHYDATGSGDGTADSADETDPAPDEGDVRLVKCEGRALHISRAPEFLDDDDWRESADQVVKLERKYSDWKRKRGIT